MAKKGKQTVASSSTTNAIDVKGKGKATAGSEIDDIFAGSSSKAGERESSAPVAEDTSSIQATATASKKKQKKRKVDGSNADQPSDATKQQEEAISLLDLERERKKRKQKAPVEVVDTSNAVLAGSTSKKPKVEKRVEKRNSKVGTAAVKQDEEDELFRDSRGTSHRRQTDDGLAIYDINELNIGKGGDTALCPFDCECCF